MKILVTGATGQQGGAVIDHLLSGEFGEHEVYGLTRDLTDDRAQELVARGVHVVEGDMRDYDRMVSLISGVEGVFCVTTFFEDGPDAELAQGLAVVDAAADTGVSHLVYSSVDGAERSPLPHFQSKFAIERRIRERDLPATVVRPGYFMQNFAWLAADIEAGRLSLPVSPETVLHLVDSDDVGRAAAAAFADPARFLGESFELVGDALTLSEVATTFADALARPVEFEQTPSSAYREARGDEVADMYAWFDSGAYSPRRPDLSRFGLVPRTLAQHIDENDAWRPAPAPVR
ncbi:NmrA/HSCARG family protein [Haloferax namakaokahaiae]|uniref:NmrA/HSCARG family protein n=1 Tax=Haloferax namakaokahaiae TaxID=1748331 RepID=A0ABD5ZJW9_9EURY